MLLSSKPSGAFSFPSPSSPNLEDLIDMSQFGSSSSRESSPNHLPATPTDESFDPALSNSLYQSILSGINSKPEQAPTPPGDDGSRHTDFSFESLLSQQTIDPSSMNNIFSSYQEPSLFSTLPNSPPLSASPDDFSYGAEPRPRFRPSFAIDPSLVATPPRSNPRTPVHVREDPHSEDEDDGDDGSQSNDADDHDSIEPDMIMAAPTKTKGRKSASGIIQTGAVSKRVTSAVVAKDKDMESDDWRPSPEEYKKLSSKEKRQLRNKISARNFRVRRKEYITTLESHIADRDRLIDAIREELGASKSENDELRQEIDNLKRAMLEGRISPESLALPPPAPLDADGNLIPAPVARISPRSVLNRANTRKDIAPGSPRGFWGGSSNPLGGGVTPVHATLIPDMSFPQSALAAAQAAVPRATSSLSAALSGKPASRNAVPRVEPDNINPLLNLPMFSPPSSPPTTMSRLDAFMDLNPFTIKSAEDYRIHLWAQMAREAGASQAAKGTPAGTFQQYPTQQQQQATNPLFNGLRPLGFAGSSANVPSSPKATMPSLTSLLSGKAGSSKSGHHAYPSPPTSPATRQATLPIQRQSQQQQQQQQPTQQQAYMAALASQTLLSRMGSAFWDAFSGGSSSGGSSGKWDADKVRRVLEGKAVVRVVDIDTPTFSEKSGMHQDSSALEEKMKSLNIGSSDRAAASCKCEVPPVFRGLRK